jgi:hypothetical protein
LEEESPKKEKSTPNKGKTKGKKKSSKEETDDNQTSDNVLKGFVAFY